MPFVFFLNLKTVSTTENKHVVKCVQEVVSEAKKSWPESYEYPLKCHPNDPMCI